MLLRLDMHEKNVVTFFVVLSLLCLNVRGFLNAAESEKDPKLLRPHSPEVQKSLKSSTEYLRKNIDTFAKQGNGSMHYQNEYLPINLLAYVKGQRTIGNKDPYEDPELCRMMIRSANAILSPDCQRGGYNSGIMMMLFQDYLDYPNKRRDHKASPSRELVLSWAEQLFEKMIHGIIRGGGYGYTLNIGNPVSIKYNPTVDKTAKDYSTGRDDSDHSDNEMSEDLDGKDKKKLKKQLSSLLSDFRKLKRKYVIPIKNLIKEVEVSV